MKTTRKCNKTVLAGEGGCRVIYCHDCEVAELEVGSVSLRLDETAFRNFAVLLEQAVHNLDGMRMNGMRPAERGARNVH